MARQRGNRWQGDALFGGERKRKSFRTREEAEAWEVAVAEADNAGDVLPVHSPSSGSATTIGVFADESFEYLWGTKKSRKNLEGQLRVLLRYIGRNTQIAAIDERMVARIIGEMMRSGMANGTINRKLAILSKLLKYGRRLKLTPEVPHWDILRENEGRQKFLTKAEEQALFQRFSHLGLDLDLHLHQFLLYTGARRGEALKLEWKDVRLSSGRPTHVTFWVTKGGKARTVPLVGPAKEALEARLKLSDRGKVFPLSEHTVRTHWDRVRADLGHGDDPEFVIHMLRHTCASRLVQGGVDLKRVQEWMGHSTIQTTLRYAHLAPHDLDAVASVLAA